MNFDKASQTLPGVGQARVRAPSPKRPVHPGAGRGGGRRLASDGAASWHTPGVHCYLTAPPPPGIRPASRPNVIKTKTGSSKAASLRQLVGKCQVQFPDVGVGAGGGLEEGQLVGRREVLALLGAHGPGRGAVGLVAHKDLDRGHRGAVQYTVRLLVYGVKCNMYDDWASQTALSNSRHTQQNGTCLCYKARASSGCGCVGRGGEGH